MYTLYNASIAQVFFKALSRSVFVAESGLYPLISEYVRYQILPTVFANRESATDLFLPTGCHGANICSRA